MTRRRALSPAQEAEVIRLNEQGMSVNKLSDHFGVSVQPIKRILRAARARTVSPAPGLGALPLPVLGGGELEPTAEEIDRGELIRERVKRGGLHVFMRQFWAAAEPADFLDNWHLHAMCEQLERVTAGDCKRLVVNIPPGHSKSLAVSVFWPTWNWTQLPADRYIIASFDISLCRRDAERSVNIISDEDFQLAFGDLVSLKVKNPAFGNFSTKAGGLRFSTSPEGKGTGRHAHKIVIDDPMKPQDAISLRKSAFDKVNNWFDGTLQTRAADPKNLAIVIIMQRLHTDDLAGRCLANGYESLILPMRQVKRTMWARDPRAEGEILWKGRHTDETIRALELTLKHEASAQLQQDPTPPTGGIIEEPWTRLEWIEPPTKGHWVQSWDFSSKGTLESHSKVSGQLWCVTRELGSVRELLSELSERLQRVPGAAQEHRVLKLPEKGEWFVLIDWVGGHWNFVQSKAGFVKAQDRPHWKKAKKKLIEEKANGMAIIEEMRLRFQGIVAVTPIDDKEARLRVHSEKFELQQVVLPPGHGDVVREELVKFPRFTHDDHVDTCTQALDELSSRTRRYRENLRRIANDMP